MFGMLHNPKTEEERKQVEKTVRLQVLAIFLAPMMLLFMWFYSVVKISTAYREGKLPTLEQWIGPPSSQEEKMPARQTKSKSSADETVQHSLP